MKLDAQPTPAPIRAEIARLLALPRAEGQRHVHEIVGRFFARSRNLRERYTVDYVPDAIATGVTCLWTVLDSRDRDRAFALALEADVAGAVVVSVTDSHNALVMDVREIASLCYPEAELAPTLKGTQSLWSGERARTLLGFEPQYSVARFFGFRYWEWIADNLMIRVSGYPSGASISLECLPGQECADTDTADDVRFMCH